MTEPNQAQLEGLERVKEELDRKFQFYTHPGFKNPYDIHAFGQFHAGPGDEVANVKVVVNPEGEIIDSIVSSVYQIKYERLLNEVPGVISYRL